MPGLNELLKLKLTAVILGASGESLDSEEVSKFVQVYGLDARAEKGADRSCIRAVVAPNSQKGWVMKERKMQVCSSLLDPLEERIQAYGLSDEFTLVNNYEVAPCSFMDFLRLNDISQVDYLKTDLEGLDFSIIQSIPLSILREILAIRCELRFVPFYDGEVPLDVAVAYLREQGFDALDIDVERCRFATPMRELDSKGHAGFCNVLFLNRTAANDPSGVKSSKQSLLLHLLGYLNVAEYILEKAAGISDEKKAVLRNVLMPPSTLGNSANYGCKGFSHVVKSINSKGL